MVLQKVCSRPSLLSGSREWEVAEETKRQRERTRQVGHRHRHRGREKGGQRKRREQLPRTSQWVTFQEAQWTDIQVPVLELGTCSPGAHLDLAQAAAIGQKLCSVLGGPWSLSSSEPVRLGDWPSPRGTAPFSTTSQKPYEGGPTQGTQFYNLDYWELRLPYFSSEISKSNSTTQAKTPFLLHTPFLRNWEHLWLERL